MDDTSDHDLIPKEEEIEENDSHTDSFLKDTPPPRHSISKVSLRLPFKSDSFKAPSLLARFHSSRKSESGIKSDIKPSFNAPWGGFSRVGKTLKSGTPSLEKIGTGGYREITSASLPDDLNQNINSLKSVGEENGENFDKRRTQSLSKSNDDSSCLPPPNPDQKSSESWFGTWPGRPRKLKSLKKRLTISGTKNILPPVTLNNELEVQTEDEADSPFLREEDVSQSINRGLLKLSEEQSSVVEMNNLLGTRNEENEHHVSLDTLLESLPLVYHPSSKQLCLANKTNKSNRLDKNDFTFKNTTTKRMSKPKGLERSDCKEPLEIVNIKSEESDFIRLGLELDESQNNALLKTCDTGENLISSKHLEIIQEVDESSENARLVGKDAPRSCDVSGSSSLERGAFESPRNSLQRASTTNSLSITDASSFSSLSSSNTELSAYSASDSAVCLASHLSETSSLRDFSSIEGENKNKKKGISDFFTRNLFSWRHKDGSNSSTTSTNDVALSSTSSSPVPSPVSSSTSSSWRIFSRPSPKAPRSPDVKARNCDVEAGSVGLIMENRPNNLPAKTADEQSKHKQEYQQMVSAAKKKELRDAKERKKAHAILQKQEEQLAAAVATWNNDFLPKWDVMHKHKKCRELWWQGIPSCVRGKVWKMAIGNDLTLTPQLYHIMVQRSKEKLVTLSECGSVTSQDDVTSDCGDQEGTIELIRLDVSRTFPHLCIFQMGGPYHDPLHHILGAYACYRPDVGYVQGMSFLAATLLLNMDESDVFIAFSNLLNRRAHMAFFRMDQPVMCAYYKTFEELLAVNLPLLAEHLKAINVTPDLYVLDWLLTVFSRPLPLDAAVRIWDVYLRDGEEFLIRAAIGILKVYENVLTSQECTATAAQFLTKLPEDLCVDALFRAIASIRTSAHKHTFLQILQAHLDAVGSSRAH